MWTGYQKEKRITKRKEKKKERRGERKDEVILSSCGERGDLIMFMHGLGGWGKESL